MPFRDRREAGRRLAERLSGLRATSPLILGLPRGGVPVAYEVAKALGAPLDILVVRKLGVPFQPELGMGAVGEGGVRVDDQLAGEEPLEIRIGGKPLTVMMRTPGHERELALGFLFGEGIIRSVADVAGLHILPNGEHPDLENVIEVDLGSEAPGIDRRWQRNFLAASSCGLCGVSSIEAIHQSAAPLPEDHLAVDPEVIYGLDARLRSEQAVFARTGGLHAAGLFTVDGELMGVALLEEAAGLQLRHPS